MIPTTADDICLRWSSTFVAPINVDRGGCTSCHVPYYNPRKSCDVEACTPAEKAKWCADARAMANLGIKGTGGSSTVPVATGIWGLILTTVPKLGDLFGAPTAVVGMSQGMAAYTSNYVDGVCSAN